jgi:protein-tyrosine phosphatase
MIDLHAHMLPGLDDGPASIDEALTMARVAVDAGTRAVAATSHVNHGYALTIDELEEARDALAACFVEADIPLELLAGGEIGPSRLPDLDDDALRRIALGGGPYVLLECPFSPVGSGMGPMVDDLRRRGFEVLLAHPERSPSFQREPQRLAGLIERGALAQVTSGSLAGAFGGVAQQAAESMLQKGLVHVLASDAHDPAHRSPDMRLAAGALDEDQFAWMTTAAPAAILAGEPLPPRPPLPRARRGLAQRLRAWSAR